MIKIRSCLKWFFLGLVLLFIYAPILLLTFNSFNESTSITAWKGFGISHYEYFFSFDHEPLPVVLQTLALAFVVAALSALLGTMGAIGIFYCKRKSSSVLSGVNQIPVINADVVTAISFALLVVALGMDKSTYIPLVVGQMVLCTPFVVLSVLPKLKQMDNNLYEAALDLGASPTKALFSVVLPQILPGVLSGFLLSVTLSLDDYVIAEYTKPDSFKTISTYLYAIKGKQQQTIFSSFWAFTAVIFSIIVIAVVVANVSAGKKAKNKTFEK